MLDRVCYFSRSDLSLGYYLEMAEMRIQEVSKVGMPSDLEGIIELWHIKQMFDNDCRLLKWDDKEYQTLKDQTLEYNNIIARFFNGLNPKTIKNNFELLEWGYKKTFWEIIDAYKLYKLLEPETLRAILTENINYVREVLECQGIVEKFKSIIREVLISNVNCAHILLDKYVAKQDLHVGKKIYLPSNLTLEDKEQMLINYLQSDEPNINYVRLIIQIKNVKDQIRISPKTRLFAERLEKRLNDEIFNIPKAATIHLNVNVQFVNKEGIPPIDVKFDKNDMPSLYSYSVPFIKECDNVKRVGNCISLFGWLNKHFLVDLISKRTECDSIESLQIDKGRDAYPDYMLFNHRNRLSLAQLNGYDRALAMIGSSFEYELKQFYEHHLTEEYEYPGLPLNFPNKEDSALNKCRVLCPELDAIVKQYNTFVTEDEIDNDLIRVSPPLKIEEGKSLLVNKYYEIAEDNIEIQRVLGLLLGAGNALLTHVDPFKEKNYYSLAELLENEKDVQYSNYVNFQKPHLDFLIQQGIIGLNKDGFLYIANQSMLNVLKSLGEYGVCSYWHYNEEERALLDNMLAKGWLKQDDHLLCKPEREYFSYFLDNAKYTNGYAYRNHYMHGSTPSTDDEDKHIIAYLTFLRLLAMLLLKIEDDLWLAQRAIAIYANSKYRKNI